MYKNLKENYPLYEVRTTESFRALLDEGAELFGDKAAFRFKVKGGEIKSVSYREFRDEVDAFGTGLYELGLGKAHIAVIGENCYGWARAYFTVLATEGVVIPIDKDLSDEETQYILDFSDAEAVICTKNSESKLDRLLPSLPKLKTVICLGTPAEGEGRYAADALAEKGRELLAGGDKRFTEAPIDNYVLKELLFTSGTTGKSKGVMLSADTLLFNIMQSQKLMKITDVCLSVLPYHHSYDSTCGLLTMFHHGMTICINESLRSVLPNFKVYKPTEVQLVPLFVEKIYRGIWDKAEETGKAGMLRKLIKVSNAMLKVGIDMRKKLFKSVTSTFGGELLGIICGGAPLKPFLPDFFDSIGITLINGYGISECGPLVSINRPCFHDYESVGLPLPETEIRIDNPNENGEGEICVKGRNVMLGYYKNEAATAEAITDGYFHTGDIGKLGHDGFLFITGRMKNVIILQNGKNVYPEEIEDKLSAMCEYIGEIIIFASKKDENGDQTVLGAEIFPDAERAAARGISDVQEVIKKAISDYNEKEPSYKVIKNIVFRTEEFEKTTSKKIKRKYD